MKNGTLIAVEGMDGSGKSEVTKYIAEKFTELNIDFVKTYEVGGTPIGKEIRKICFTKREDEVMDPRAALLMVLASRIQHNENIIKPAIMAGKWVLVDRYSDSTRVYQGYIDKLAETIRQVENISSLNELHIRPQHTIFLDVNPEVAFSRGKARVNVDNDRYKQDLDKAIQIGNAYKDLMTKMAIYDNSRFIYTIDANQDFNSVKLQLDDAINGIMIRENIK